MHIVNRKEPFILFVGDLLCFIASLWITLALRYFEIPDVSLWESHIAPFSIVFILSIVLFYVAGLYERHTLVFKNALPNVLLNTQIINSIVAVLVFYFVPYFSITPKTNLFIYLVVSIACVYVWRLFVLPWFSPKIKQRAVVIGTGKEMDELVAEVNKNNIYSFSFVQIFDIEKNNGSHLIETISQYVRDEHVTIVVVDLSNGASTSLLPSLYDLLFAKVQFVDLYVLYESIFGRAPLSLLNHGWFLEHVSPQNRFNYDLIKRITDIITAVVCGCVSLVVYPFVYIAIKLDDGGTLFYFDERVGQHNKTFSLIKFRSMTNTSDGGKKVTRVGAFLRKTRIDELPQLLNVLRGEMSLIGPRPEKTDLTAVYTNQIPFYGIRNIIKPGLSGWAQLYQDNHPHHQADRDATAEKLSYDLFYIKNRSIFIDIKIALQTVRVLLSQKGR